MTTTIGTLIYAALADPLRREQIAAAHYYRDGSCCSCQAARAQMQAIRADAAELAKRAVEAGDAIELLGQLLADRHQQLDAAQSRCRDYLDERLATPAGRRCSSAAASPKKRQRPAGAILPGESFVLLGRQSQRDLFCILR